MPDSLPYQQCRQLKEEGEQLRKAHQFIEAAQLFKQAYDLCHDNYAASRYIHCLCRTGDEPAREAAKFARQAAQQFPDNQYIKNEWAWALYYGYLKNPEGDEAEEDETVDDQAPERATAPTDFTTKVKAARNIFQLTTDPFAQKQAAFALCKEAKLLKKWELMLEFSQKLDPAKLSLDPNEFNGRRNKSDYQRWLFAITRSSFELEHYDECKGYARDAIEKFPDDSFYFRWWEALANVRMGNVEEGLHQLEYINMYYPNKQWFVQRDIADTYKQLNRYDEAWVWYCRAATIRGDIKGRISMLKSMVDLLQRLEHWQAAYEHLLLVWAIEIEFGYKYVGRTRQQIIEFRKHHADHLRTSSEVEMSPPTISSTIKPCSLLWQKTISESRPSQHGRVSFLNEEKRYGFVTNDNGRFHFKFSAFRGKPTINMWVEFETEESFDQKRNEKSDIAINIRPSKEPT